MKAHSLFVCVVRVTKENEGPNAGGTTFDICQVSTNNFVGPFFRNLAVRVLGGRMLGGTTSPLKINVSTDPFVGLHKWI